MVRKALASVLCIVLALALFHGMACAKVQFTLVASPSLGVTVISIPDRGLNFDLGGVGVTWPGWLVFLDVGGVWNVNGLGLTRGNLNVCWLGEEYGFSLKLGLQGYAMVWPGHNDYFVYSNVQPTLILKNLLGLGELDTIGFRVGIPPYGGLPWDFGIQVGVIFIFYNPAVEKEASQ